ncbi:ubiquinone biosynthesis protein COQ4 homolog, mitochondrial [Thrips palmi]|uniref:Ubiquinone biosynthesis protein COQ4 homolog, mitochondrial n=1 Tax=Thrips palmi TaxID=161013 RepID=A0A6P9ADB8_THRPL|nr:ubiquinone biosynthesis protein COQ4 homolog, mitochondrial [Thrips palmi]XP_034255506.1 ubiquinone biosynthesis protein COQ4 homolog, mitochondrial [Thrips palmi]
MSFLSSRHSALTLARQSQRYQELVFRFIHRAPLVLHEETQQKTHSDSECDNGDVSFDSVFASNHIPTSLFQRVFLSIGSAGISITDPSRGDMIATLGETTGSCALQMMLQTMENDEEGRKILSERPRLTSKTINLSKLKSMPEGTLGRAYSNFLTVNNVSPDSRATTQFVDDVELAYVMQRYREMHDLIHTILQMRTNMLGEVTVKWVEAIQTKLPMCVGGALFGSIRLSKKQRQKYISEYLPWAIRTGWESKFLLNLYFEKRWDQTLEELQKEMNIVPLEIEKGTYVK